MLNIVIPMAGHGSRFQQAGFQLPKPLIPVGGKPMIQVVINNLRPACPHRFIFICLQEHIEKYKIDESLRSWQPSCEIVPVKAVTEGAACTVLLSKHFIDSDNPLMIANSDQWVDVDINDYLKVIDKPSERRVYGLIMTMWADDPKWSYIRLDENGRPTEVIEKKVVSNEATVGIYNFRYGSKFVAAAEHMIYKNIRVNNEFYVAPVYNEFIASGKALIYYNVGREGAGMYGLGIPSDLSKFESSPVLEKAISFV